MAKVKIMQYIPLVICFVGKAIDGKLTAPEILECVEKHVPEMAENIESDFVGYSDNDRITIEEAVKTVTPSIL